MSACIYLSSVLEFLPFDCVGDGSVPIVNLFYREGDGKLSNLSTLNREGDDLMEIVIECFEYY